MTLVLTDMQKMTRKDYVLKIDSVMSVVVAEPAMEQLQVTVVHQAYDKVCAVEGRVPS